MFDKIRNFVNFINNSCIHLNGGFHVEKQRYIYFIIAILIIPISFSNLCEGSGGQPMSLTKIEVAIRGYNYISSGIGIVGAIEEQIDDYEWIVDNKVYVINTTRVNLTNIIEGDLSDYDVLIESAIFDEHFWCSFPNLKLYKFIHNLYEYWPSNLLPGDLRDLIFKDQPPYKTEDGSDLKKIFLDYVKEGGGYIGHCSGGAFPLELANPPTTGQERTVHQNNFTGEYVNVQTNVHNGYIIFSEYFSYDPNQPVYHRPIHFGIFRDNTPAAVGQNAYLTYPCSDKEDPRHYFGNIPINVTIENKNHPIFSDYLEDSWRVINSAGQSYKLKNLDNSITILARWPEEAIDDNDDLEINAWEWSPRHRLDEQLIIGASLGDPLSCLYFYSATHTDILKNFKGRFGDFHKTKDLIKTDINDDPAFVALEFPNENHSRIVIGGGHPSQPIWYGGRIESVDDTKYNSLTDGLIEWVDTDTGDPLVDNNIKIEEPSKWFLRREVAWASNTTPDNHMPPVYGRSQVVDIDPPFRNNVPFKIQFCVGRESNKQYETLNLSLFYRYKGENYSDGTEFTNWTYYNHIIKKPYNCYFNADNTPYGCGYYQFYSILNTTSYKSTPPGYICDNPPPGPDAECLIGCPLLADFTFNISNPSTSQTIQFTDSSITKEGTTITNYTWDFDDGNKSYIQNPIHGYPDDGIFNITLNITNSNSNTDEISKTLTVRNRSPQASFTQSALIVFVNEKVVFTDQSSDPDGYITNWTWNLGQNATTYTQNTNQTYMTSGMYQIKLQVTDDDNSTDYTTRVVFVIDKIVDESFTGESQSTWSTIQQAIDNSSSLDIIYIQNGTYNENIVINKSLSLFGESKAHVIINGSVSINNPHDYELPDYRESNFFSNMSGNVLLFHCNNDSLVYENYSSSDLVFDYSGIGNNGTHANIKWTSNAIKGDGAFDFNGVNDSINISTCSAFAGKNITVSSWVFWNGSQNTINPVISACTSTGIGYCLYINGTSDKPVFRINSTEAVSSTALTTGWQHIVGTHNETKITIFVDGKIKTQIESSGKGSDFPVFIGHDNNTGYFDGCIDEISVWNRTLSADEIKWLYEENYGVVIDGMTIKNNTVGIIPCNYTFIHDVTLFNNTIGVLINNSINVIVSSTAISNGTVGIRILDSPYDANNSIWIVDTNITNLTNAIQVNSSANIRILRTVMNVTGEDLYYTDCNTTNMFSMDSGPSDNVAPDTPSIPSGPMHGDINTSYTYTTTTNDSNSDQLIYLFDWGDGNFTQLPDFYQSNLTVNASHTWTIDGGYYIRVKAFDVFEEDSNWTTPILFKTEFNPPEINSVSDSPDTVGFGFNVTITVNATDDQAANDSGIKTVYANIVFPDTSSQNLSLNYTGNNTYQLNFTDTWQVGQYNYTIWAMDKAYNLNSSTNHSFNVTATASMTICTIKDSYGSNQTINLTDPPTGKPPIGYEYLDNDQTIHLWNTLDHYYFNATSGIQLTNHKDQYWSQNVLMLGYYNNDQWNLMYRTDELTGFTKDLDTDNTTFVNLTLWKNLKYAGHPFKLAIRYHLGLNDNELTVIPYIKNRGSYNPYDLAFGWELKNIQINMTTDGDYIEVNNTKYYLNQSLDKTYTNLSVPILRWNKTTEQIETIGYTDPTFTLMEASVHMHRQTNQMMLNSLIV